MATIVYPLNTNHGRRTQSGISKIIEGLEEIERVLEAADTVAYDGEQSPTFSRLESNTDFLIGSGDGEAFRNALNAIKLKMNDAELQFNLNALDKGGT